MLEEVLKADDTKKLLKDLAEEKACVVVTDEKEGRATEFIALNSGNLSTA